MKYIKYISLFSLLLFCLENNAQISTIGKATVKTGVKAGVKSVAKKSIKEAAEKAVINEIKEVAIKKGVKSVVVNKLQHDISLSVASEISQKAFKESSDNIIKKSTKISGEKIIKHQTQQIAKGSISTSGKVFLKKKISSYLIGTVKEIDIAEYGIKKTVNKTVTNKEISKSLNLDVKHIQKVLGEPTYKQVEQFLPDVASKKILLNDIVKNPQLAKNLKRNPTFIQNYSQCLNSHYRTDIATLRYLNNRADFYADACMFSKNKYLRAKELKFVDQQSKTLVKNNQTGETLGIIEGDVIRISSNNHSLLNMKLMKNMKYHVDNTIYQTDIIGRPIYVKTTINSKFKGSKFYDRDKIIQKDFRNARINSSGLDSEKLNDDAGHIIAHDLGGISDGINILPQNASLNRGAYKKMENKIKKDIKKGCKAEIVIQINYKGSSERPNDYIYTYYKNGSLNSREIFYNLK